MRTLYNWPAAHRRAVLAGAVLAGVALFALLSAGHGTVHGQAGPAAQASSTAPPPPPPPPPPTRPATTAPTTAPPPPPTLTATVRATSTSSVTATAARATPSVAGASGTPVINVALPSTGTGGAADTSLPLLPIAFGAAVLACLGYLGLRRALR